MKINIVPNVFVFISVIKTENIDLKHKKVLKNHNCKSTILFFDIKTKLFSDNNAIIASV